MTQVMAPPCERCGWALDPYALACRNCGGLAHRAELQRLAAEATRLETIDPAAAALCWRRCLSLLPREAGQYAAIYHRLAALSPGSFGYAHDPHAREPHTQDAHARGPAAGPGTHPMRGPDSRAAPPPDDPPLVAVLKTGGSMLVSILAYALFISGDLAGRLLFATGFVVLILVHELGHVAAMRYYGLSASPPIFIPFLGALIRLRQAPPDAKAEAIVGLGGPLAGTVGALACYGLYLVMPPDAAARDLVYILAFVGFMLNLFNLLPVPPLDGGRITAAVSPKIWMLGIAGLIGLIVKEVVYDGRFPIILVLVLLIALPRVGSTLARRRAGAADPYYAITRTARQGIGAVYFALGLLLSGFCYAMWGVWDML